MIEQLFGSKTRVKLLQLFYGNPNRSYYVREITRNIDEQINSVRRELANLLSIGIISSETTSHRLYYEVNQKYEHYQPLQQVFGGSKKSTSAKVAVAKEDEPLKAIGNVDLAIFMGQFTRDDSATVDVVIAGDVNHSKLSNYIDELEKKEGKELRYVLMTPKDLSYRLEVNDRFIASIMDAKKQILIDKNNVFGQAPVEETPKKDKIKEEE